MKTLREEAQEEIIKADKDEKVKYILGKLRNIEQLNTAIREAEADIKRVEEGGELYPKKTEDRYTISEGGDGGLVLC